MTDLTQRTTSDDVKRRAHWINYHIHVIYSLVVQISCQLPGEARWKCWFKLHGWLLTHFLLMTLMVIANVARIEKQIASAMPACIPTLNPSCGLIPAQH